MPGHVDEIRKGLAKLKAAMEARSEPFDEQWQWLYRKIECALVRLKDYAGDRTLDTDDDLADVLADYLWWGVDELRTMTEELDDRYAGSS
jgi:hypothetical protein